MATKAVVPKRDVDLEQKALSWPEKARALAVVDQRSYTLAADALRGIKDLRAELDVTFDPIIVKARESLNTARETKAKLERPLADAEKILKDNRVAWFQEQEHIRFERQQLADREAEERAAKQRARELADAKRQGASRAELKAVAAQPVMVVPVTVESTVEKVAGISMQDHWSAEVDPAQASSENAAVLILAQAVAKGKIPICGVLPNMTYLNQQARSLKTLFDVPGFRAVNHPTEAVRRG
jgi:hypothetical protein